MVEQRAGAIVRIAVIIPARYGSTRFPGKPLAMIGGKTILQRVVETGRQAKADLMVATEDDRIAAHCREIGVDCVMTSPDCPTGSDRVLEAAEKSGKDYDFIINLQGDVPFAPPILLTRMIEEIEKRKEGIEVITPVFQLDWDGLDRLREEKKKTPFSGTTVTRKDGGYAMWFSKQIIPAMRNEQELRKQSTESPVFKHIGIYGYRRDVLERFVKMPQTHNERLEGLEQLRLLENGISVFTVKITFPDDSIEKRLQIGIDSPEDLQRAQALFS